MNRFVCMLLCVWSEANCEFCQDKQNWNYHKLCTLNILPLHICVISRQPHRVFSSGDLIALSSAIVCRVRAKVIFFSSKAKLHTFCKSIKVVLIMSSLCVTLATPQQQSTKKYEKKHTLNTLKKEKCKRLGGRLKSRKQVWLVHSGHTLYCKNIQMRINVELFKSPQLLIFLSARNRFFLCFSLSERSLSVSTVLRSAYDHEYHVRRSWASAATCIKLRKKISMLCALS